MGGDSIFVRNILNFCFMKRQLLTLLMTSMILMLFGCEKGLEKSLEGTVWEKDDAGFITTITYRDGTCEMKMSDYENEESYFYAYEYNFPVVLMYPENDDLALMRGIISDSQTTMNVVNTSTNKTVGTFVRRD